MFRLTRDWVIKQLLFEEFRSYNDVVRKAVWVGIKVSLLACGLNICAHLLLSWFDLLPYALSSALIVASVLTPPITFILATTAYVAVGFSIHDLGVSRAEFERLSRTDTLSGLANRRAFVEMFDQCDREKSMLVFDVDRFKKINDTYGHQMGDAVIVEVARMLKAAFGEDCACARIGGEEFAVFTGSMPFAEFVVLGETARRNVAEMQMNVGEREISVTMSGGAARSLPHQTFDETFSRADKALYAAKSGGRNRIVLSYSTEPVSANRANNAAAA
ncbi:GGDEF domain-containing protein [Hoeflea sp. G2-23]|uniref:diguanylate cyclase n=1 Tax=Hoeflea algicola TaxID=2983763 RepID=A0ABT3Z7W8_9HYPH|nr:GGDEF domain-containing protein [Hoeflea algicola]MCY0147865.1 GGDEF domain-containing protein [Hoeflea algicola]